jgi:hypothetical protein
MIHIVTEADDTKIFNLRYLESVTGNLIESGEKYLPMSACLGGIWPSPIWKRFLLGTF